MTQRGKGSVEDLLELLYKQVSGSRPTERPIRHDPYLEAADGQFLGTLKPNRYDSESIFNPYGAFGSQYSGDLHLQPVRNVRKPLFGVQPIQSIQFDTSKNNVSRE